MFRFEHPSYLHAFYLVPFLAGVFWLYWRWRKQAIARFAESHLVPLLMPEAKHLRHRLKFGLAILAVAFLVLGVSNPQWGNKREKVKRRSADVLIALDISNSMYAQDVPPSRLERAKKFAENLVEKLKGERIGLIYFAGSAYLQMPVTTDYAAAELFLRSASPELAASQGTALGEAINVARRAFQVSGENKSHKALIIITDGEDHDGQALSEAENAKEEGIIQFTVGVGTPEGSFIPIELGGREDYKRDENGQPVLSRLNEAMLTDLAQKGGGTYLHISEGDAAVAEALQTRIDQLEKQELEVQAFSSYNSYFQYFVFIGLVFLAIEWWIRFGKGEKATR